LSDRAAGEGTETLLLSPKGKIEFAARLAVLPGGVVLADTDAAAAAGLAERLARFVFRYDVDVGEPAAGAASVLGDGAPAALERAGLPVPPAPGRVAVAGEDARPLVVHRTPLGVDLVGPGSGEAAERLRDAGVAPAPAGVLETLRVERGLPRWGRELTDDVIAEEAGLLDSHVHLDKGCYPGQETVARVHNLGQVQRRLAGLRVAGDRLPEFRADLVTADGRRAGQVRSAVTHPELGGIALAYVRRVVPESERVSAGDVAAEVVSVPFGR
jgi:folate-binding protein YgfZ